MSECDTNTVWALLEPEDLLLFRDSRPFSAGADFRAEGTFPPLPTPIAGAIRTALLAPVLRARGRTFGDFVSGDAALSDVALALGDANSLGGLHLAGPFVCSYGPWDDRAEPLFPVPADVLGRRVPTLGGIPASIDTSLGIPAPPGMKRKAVPGLPDGMPIAVAPPVPGPQAGEDADESDEGLWIDSGEMGRYLGGADAIRRLGPDEAPADAETLVGIERSSQTRTAQTGMLYNIQMQRMRWEPARAYGLLVRVCLPCGYALPDGPLFLGGETRCAYLHTLNGYAPSLDGQEMRQQLAKAICENEGRFRLYLATPGVFAEGAVPASLLSGDLDGLPVRLVAAATGKPVPVGGWNLAEGAPRPLRRAVPAGSVYYCKLTMRDSADAARLVDALHLTTTLQANDRLPEAAYRAQMGFGLTLVGTWATTQERKR